MNRGPTCLAAALGCALLGTRGAPAQTIAIVGGTVYPITGPKIERGIVLMRDGRIAAVGASVPVPPEATQIDAVGMWITPGLIHAGTDVAINLTETGAQEATQEGIRSGDINAAFNVAEAIDPHSLTIAPTRMGGVTTVITAPSGGLIAGQAVAVDLIGERIEDMVIASPAAMVIDLGQGGKQAGGGSRAGALLRVRQIFQDAKDYAQRRADYRRAQMQPLAAPAGDLEALQPVLTGQIPVYALADRKSDIESALRLAREYRLKLVIWGGAEAWQAAGDLAAANVPVAIEPFADIPSFNGLGARLDNAARLREAGVTVLIVQRGVGPNDRLVRFAAGNAVSYGMSWEDALKALTVWPAQAFGLDRRYGSLESGKVANVVIWSGDPLELSTRAVKVFIRGSEVPMRSRQTELLDRYRALPPKY